METKTQNGLLFRIKGQVNRNSLFCVESVAGDTWKNKDPLCGVTGQKVHKIVKLTNLLRSLHIDGGEVNGRF